jgi:hypothetical protein
MVHLPLVRHQHVFLHFPFIHRCLWSSVRISYARCVDWVLGEVPIFQVKNQTRMVERGSNRPIHKVFDEVTERDLDLAAQNE